MKKTLYSVLSMTLFFIVTVPHAHAFLLSSQPDSSGTPSHYWHSDGSTGAYLVLDPADGGPGYSLGDIATTTSNVIGIHIKAQFNTDGLLTSLQNIPRLYDESGNQLYACSQPSFQGFAYGSAADAQALQNPLQNADYNGKMIDMYFVCAVGSGHDQIYPSTSYRLYFYPISALDVDDIYVAMNAAGTEPFYEVSGDGTYPPPQAPITISVPQQGTTYFSTDTIIPQATIANLASYTSVIYLLNGNPVDPTQPLPIASLPSGTSTLVIAATDSLGNTTYATSTFMVVSPDTTPPSISITNPIAGATYTDTSNVFLVSTVTDASPIAATSYTFNGNTIDPTQPLPLLGAPLGPASVSVAATDIYGNAASTTVNFFIKSSDVTPPTIIITNPLAGHTYVSTTSVFAAATITDASGVATSSYALDGIAVNPAQPLPLNLAGDGPATLVVTATDNFGNTASSSVSFIVSTPPPPDTQGPVVVIVSPTAGKKYARNDSVLVVANITDASAIANVRYYFNGKLIDQSKPLQLSKAPLGTATVSVVATDVFGNVGSSTITFRILPGSNSCIEDITDAFDHKYIANKNVFKSVFEDCQKINDREHDRDNYGNDDSSHHKDPSSDNRYLQCTADINNAYDDLDKNINN